MDIFLTKRICSFLVIIILISSRSQPKNNTVDSGQIILSVNAYSFSDLLSAKDHRNNQQVYSLFNLIDWCATRNIKVIDPTAYFFPSYPEVPSDDYIEKFKNRADELGIAICRHILINA